MKIYTKTGDSGESSLIGGKRVPKSNPVFAVLGNIDELNSILGVLISLLPEELAKVAGILRARQKELFAAGTMIAAIQSPVQPNNLKRITAKELTELETLIDAWQLDLPELKHFIIPGGKLHASYVHLARAVCRRCERSLVRLQHKYPIDPILTAYFNRLADWLFVLARRLNHGQETLWTGA